MTSTSLMGLFALVLPVALGSSQTPVFRADVEAVQVDVFVGRNGRAVTGLGVEDFEVFDDGRPQTLDLVRIENVPLDVALVLDVSDSVAGPMLVRLREAAHAFVDNLGDEDSASLIAFSHHLRRLETLTSDKGALHEAIDGTRARGATSWHDALYAGLKEVEAASHRPMVLLFTDGEDTYSWLPDDRLLDLVERSNAVVYAVGRTAPSPNLSASMLERQRQWRESRREHSRRIALLRDLTAASGGRLLETSSAEDLRSAFLTLLAEMKTRYLLTYRPPPPIREGWHELEVKVGIRGVDVHARRGYFYSKRR